MKKNLKDGGSGEIRISGITFKELAENMDIISPDELEKWIKEEYFSLSGKVMTDKYGDFAVIEQFAHGGMSSGGVDNLWWIEEGIPLLKSRLTVINKK